MRIPKVLFFALIAAAVAGGMLISQFALGGASAQSEGGTHAGEVRIAALTHENGRVEVALQQREANGEWGARQRPALRFVADDAPAGRWLHSSPLALTPPDDHFYCLIGHGRADDYFWAQLDRYSKLAAQRLGLNVRFGNYLDHSEQVAAIRECIADGAAAIASSIPQPSEIVGALREAREAGIRVLTYNSGSEFATEAGSSVHFQLDERAAGRKAAERLNLEQVTGRALCVIHEESNVGLPPRCEALTETYTGGPVEVLQLRDADGFDSISRRLRARFEDESQPALAVIVSLSGDTMIAAMAAVEGSELCPESERCPRVAAVGATPRIATFPPWVRERNLTTVDDAGSFQGYLITASFHMWQNYHRPDFLILGTPILSIDPYVNNAAGYRTQAAAETLDSNLELIGDDPESRTEQSE